jgi:hypothetical protein
MNRRDGSFFEQAARAEKVAKLLAHVPPAVDFDGDIRAANLMASWSKIERDLFAKDAGVNPASEATWGDLLAALISRNAQPRTSEVSREHWNDEWSA